MSSTVVAAYPFARMVFSAALRSFDFESWGRGCVMVPTYQLVGMVIKDVLRRSPHMWQSGAMEPTNTLIYKILKRQEWLAAKDAGQFTGSEVDRRDGYIHFSTATQAVETARLHFRGQADLVVLEVRTEGLGKALVWEASRGGQ